MFEGQHAHFNALKVYVSNVIQNSCFSAQKCATFKKPPQKIKITQITNCGEEQVNINNKEQI